MGEAAESSAKLSNLNKMHTVLIQRDNTPIERAAAIRNFDIGRMAIEDVKVRTD